MTLSNCQPVFVVR